MKSSFVYSAHKKVKNGLFRLIAMIHRYQKELEKQ